MGAVHRRTGLAQVLAWTGEWEMSTDTKSRNANRPVKRYRWAGPDPAFLAEHRAAMATHRVHTGAMFSCIGASTFLYEPALYWQDARTVFHERMMDPEYLARLPVHAANPEGARLVETLRTGLIRLMHAHGAAHFQVGRLYPYLDGRDRGALRLLRAIKRELDPDNLLNPGALGL